MIQCHAEYVVLFSVLYAVRWCCKQWILYIHTIKISGMRVIR